MRQLPPRTRILAALAVAVALAAGLYFFKFHKAASTSPPVPAVATPIGFVTRANSVCLLETRDGVRPVAAPASAGHGISRAAIQAAVHSSVQDLPRLLTITPPAAQATVWDRYLQVNGEALNVLISLRSLARNHAGQAQLTRAAAALTPLYALQRTLAAELSLTACATPR